MKKIYFFAALLTTAVGSLAFHNKTAEPAGQMMVISSVSIGLDAQANITTIAPDGTRKEKVVDFSKGSAKKVAANMTEVHKATLATINEHTRNGWHVVGVAPSGLATAGTTFFTQSVYVLEKL